jgi:hypothetical protein
VSDAACCPPTQPNRAAEHRTASTTDTFRTAAWLWCSCVHSTAIRRARGTVWYHCGITAGAMGPLAYLRALTLTLWPHACRTHSLTRSAGLSALLLPPPTAPSALTAHWDRPPLRSVRAAQRAAAPSSPIRPPLIAQLPMLCACRAWRAAAASRAPCHAACCLLHAVTAPPGWAVPGFQIRCATAGWCRSQAQSLGFHCRCRRAVVQHLHSESQRSRPDGR